MPIIQNTNQPIQSGFDAAAFLALVQDPKAYAAKLAELEAARSAAQKAQEEAETAFILVGKANEIVDLHAKAKADRQSASDALNQANGEAAKIKVDAQAKADALAKDAQEKISAAQNAWLEKAKELDEREAALAGKESELAKQLAIAQDEQKTAKTATDSANASKVNSDNAVKAAYNKLDLINTKFAEFIAAIK